VKEDQPVQTPIFDPPTAEGFLPAEVFSDATPSKTWDLDTIRITEDKK
jgi:hypothetical protein